MITTLNTAQSYVADGVQTDFSVPFQFIDPTYLEVFLVSPADVSVQQTYGSDYSVSQVEGSGTYGTIIFVTAPTNGYTVQITRTVPFLQSTDLQVSGRFNPEEVEAMADKIVLMLQGLTIDSGFNLRFRDDEPLPIKNLIPTKSSRKTSFLGFDANGDLTTYSSAQVASIVSLNDSLYESISITGDFELSTSHANKAIHVVDPVPATAQITVTLPDAGEGFGGFFCTIIKTGSIPIVFSSGDTIDAEVDPVTIIRDNSGVVVYTHNGNWKIVGAIGAGGGGGSVNITQQSGIIRSPAAPATPFQNQPWIDTANGNVLKIWNGTAWVASNKVLDLLDFGTGIRPIVRVAAKPALPDSRYPDGTVIYLTTDNKLWRNVNDNWTEKISTSDLVGTVEATDIIAAGTIVAGLIGAGEISAEQVNVSQVLIAANAMVGNAVIEDANITSLSASKLAADIITAAIQLNTPKISSNLDVVNVADNTRPMPPIGRISHNLSGAPAIADGTIPVSTATWYYFTHDDLIFYNWLEGTAAKIANRIGSSLTPFQLNVAGNATTATQDLLYGFAYRTRTSGGAWNSWADLGYNMNIIPGQGSYSSSWQQDLPVSPNVDFQFGVRWAKIAGATSSVSTMLMSGFAFNL